MPLEGFITKLGLLLSSLSMKKTSESGFKLVNFLLTKPIGPLFSFFVSSLKLNLWSGNLGLSRSGIFSGLIKIIGLLLLFEDVLKSKIIN